MDYTAPAVLSDSRVTLLPLSRTHRDGLADATRDGELWRLWYTSVPSPEQMDAEIDRRLGLRAAGSMNPWTITRTGSGEVLGMTTYLNVDQPNRRLEIGSTWLRRSAQGSAVNAACKRLLLGHAFERLGASRVELCTHRLNRQSRAAIERLGARLDGVLRQHQVWADGSLRDTCVYSIIDSEWPAVRAQLDHRLAGG